MGKLNESSSIVAGALPAQDEAISIKLTAKDTTFLSMRAPISDRWISWIVICKRLDTLMPTMLPAGVPVRHRFVVRKLT